MSADGRRVAEATYDVLDAVRRKDVGAAAAAWERLGPDDMLGVAYGLARAIAQVAVPDLASDERVVVDSSCDAHGAKDRELTASIGAMIAAAGNDDAEGAALVYYANAEQAGEMIGHLVEMAAALLDEDAA